MWVFLGMETIANIKYRSHVDSDSCLLAVCRWLIPHEVAPQQSFTMLQPANAKVIIKNGTTKNNHIYFILQFDPLKHSINNSSCNLTYTPKSTTAVPSMPSTTTPPSPWLNGCARRRYISRARRATAKASKHTRTRCSTVSIS